VTTLAPSVPCDESKRRWDGDLGESGVPSVTVCPTVSWFIQVTVVPAVIVSCAGLYAKFWIIMTVLFDGACVPVFVSLVMFMVSLVMVITPGAGPVPFLIEENIVAFAGP